MNIFKFINDNKLIQAMATIVTLSPLFGWVNITVFAQLSSKDIFGFITALLTSGMMFLMLLMTREIYKKLKETDEQVKKTDEQLKVVDAISRFRSKRLFVQSFGQIQYFRQPNETDEQYWNRLPEGGMYERQFIEEYNMVKDYLTKTMKQKTLGEIENMLTDYYPINSKSNDIKR